MESNFCYKNDSFKLWGGVGPAFYTDCLEKSRYNDIGGVSNCPKVHFWYLGLGLVCSQHGHITYMSFVISYGK